MPTATYSTLKMLHCLHPQAIAFENFNPFLQKPLPLDIDSIQKKMVQMHRGGYCFEHNTLFQHALEAIGFKVRALAGRVLWRRSQGPRPARTHMLLMVWVKQQAYIVDVGFGGNTLTTPLLLATNVEQQTSHEVFKIIVGKQDEYILELKLNSSWKAMYSFTLEQQYTSDFELANWYLLHHPDSHFLNLLTLARTDNHCRYALLNNRYTIHCTSQASETILLKDFSDWKTIVKEKFLIEDKENILLKAAWEKIMNL